MTSLPFQGTIIGRDTIPKKKQCTTKWSFLKTVKLLDGQALRLVCPKGHGYSVAKQNWYKLHPGKGRTRMVANTDETVTLYLWIA